MARKILIPAIKLSMQYSAISAEIDKVISQVIQNGNFILGDYVRKFETRIAGYCQCNYAIGVASGTDALLLSLMALNINHGDEVITTPFSFFATASVISRVGATPIFVDINEDTFNIDVNKIEQAITKKTKAILPVHLFGHPADMLEIRKIAKKHNLFVVEDAAQAIGARINNNKVGSLSDIASFSFFPTKNLGAYGDGGVVTTNNHSLFCSVDLLRRQGAKQKYYHELIGINSRLDELQAAILSIKIEYLDKWIVQRRNVAKRYFELLSSSKLKMPIEKDDFFHVYHQFTICAPSHRDELFFHLKKNGIEAAIYYPYPLHLQPAFKSLGYKMGDFPACEDASRNVLSLPCYPELLPSEQEYIAEKIEEFFYSKL